MAQVSFRKVGKLPVKNLIKRTWRVVDARDQVVGRLAARLATLVTGKHKPTYTPSIDDGDTVVVFNAAHVRFTGDKWKKKLYRSHSGYVGGLKEIPAWRLHQKDPVAVLRKAVNGMLPKNSFRTDRLRRVRLFKGVNNKHRMQTGVVKVTVHKEEAITEDTLPDFGDLPPEARFESWEVDIVHPRAYQPHRDRAPKRQTFFTRQTKRSPKELAMLQKWYRALEKHGGDEAAAKQSLAAAAVRRFQNIVVTEHEPKE